MISKHPRFVRAALLAALLLSLSPRSVLAIDPRFELDPGLLDKASESHPREKAVKKFKRGGPAGEGLSEYTVRPGDHIFRILMRDYGLSNNQAEALVPEIKRLNSIGDIRRLRVGQTIRIPLARERVGEEQRGKAVEERAEHAIGSERPAVYAARAAERAEPVPGHSLKMMSVAADRDTDSMESVRVLWDGLVPATGRAAQPINIEDKNFSLSLDPETFPTFPAPDGGRVLVDAGGKLPPLVRALIEEKDPTVRIVSENPRNKKRFMASLLAGARFYSVEENVSLEFGADPRLTVNADFKIEKTPESLLRHDVVLMNVEAPREMPPSLVQFLRREGFQVLEPLSARAAQEPRRERTLHQITAREPRAIIDGLLRAFNIRYENDRNVELYGVGDGGLRLYVRADRYFEDGNARFVVSSFDGDPVTYTLMRLLETRGYRVIVLDPKDDFRKVSEKLFTRMRVPGSFARHELLAPRDTSYGIQMSGFRVRGAAGTPENAFVTSAEIDPVFRDLLDANGYTIIAH